MRNPLRQLLRSTSGNVLVLAGLSMPLLIGFAGMATDTIQWTLDKRQLQRTADSAALAGAYSIAQNKDANDSAQKNIEANNRLVLAAAPIIENAPTSGSYAGDMNAVYVELATRKPLPFSGIFMNAAPLIKARSTAAMIANGNYCVISLDTSLDVGVEATGSSYVDLNCGIFANSRSGNAVSAGGSTLVVSDVVGAVGGLTPSNRYAPGTAFLPYSAPQPDPFADLPTPEPSGCKNKVNVNPKQSLTLDPGCYSGMDIKGTVHFNPGVYYIDGGVLSFGAQANATGVGVTFILTSTSAATNPNSIATLDINGTSELNFSSPTSGDYKSVLFYQDRRAPSGTTKINGNNKSSIEGGIYFPKHLIQFNGNSGFKTDCVQLIGLKVNFTGNSAINNECPSNGPSTFRGSVVRLVS
ncbi:hypothetical protein JI743_10120 [Sphingopyxis sp. DHUNG17]|jgi:hypothetical protein|uniref:pilus assembly protein TadG-related protein n=1 Tax=Sphingopyxis TaxID=165697 RepID=UPI00191E9FE7|nr:MULTISPECIES: pilus assembly protein TadG-related protein [Sphingopyxis]MBL0769163.1 hypothetical protein [Sphingopyxis lutea]